MTLDPLLLSRIQFAFVVSFHIIFPAFTIGLAAWLATIEGMRLGTGDPVYRRVFDFWLKVFALSFGMGVVSGIVMAFQFGTNWSVLAERTGPIQAPLLGYEGFTAFLLEATFFGVMLLGRERAPPWFYFLSPFWDGNETWLVVIGASLFAAFPVVYAVFLPAFYIPVLLLLVGLIFRGVAFEFRQSDNARPLWNYGFFAGSAVAAFVQGAAVGQMIRGIPVAANQYAGGPFEWLAPLPVLTGIGLALGYALLGAGWLVLKSEGPLRDWAWRRIPFLAGAVLVVLGITALVAVVLRARMTGSLFLGRPWGFVFPAVALLAMYGVFVGARRRRGSWPFAMTALFFVAAFCSLAVLFWPYMIPYTITVTNAAAPEKSLSFLFWGAGIFVLPVIAIYTAVVYWLFRGKLRKGYG
jgi:cytochrome bd ubiquinol oxidase subunit II